jgi:hypothetical protein
MPQKQFIRYSDLIGQDLIKRKAAALADRVITLLKSSLEQIFPSKKFLGRRIRHVLVLWYKCIVDNLRGTCRQT